MTFINKLKQSLKKSQYLYLLVIFSTVVALLFSAYFVLTDQNLDWRAQITHNIGPQTNRLLDGRLVDTDRAALKPVAIMLENHYDSRPVAGLEYASIVYEAIVEGDITRFLAVFDPDIRAKKLGPVRSVRPFFIELAEEWNAVLFHAGGSQDAMYKLTYSPVHNVNEISGDGIYFWRDQSREAPHNLFTSINQINRATEAKAIGTEADFPAWSFKRDTPEEFPEETEVEVNFSQNPFYQVKYEYNQANNDYTRYLAGKVHKTESGIILNAKNIVVQHVAYQILDSYGRIAVDLVSGGDAEIYQDGKKISGNWVHRNKRTRFYDQNGAEIRFNQGTVWVELVFN